MEVYATIFMIFVFHVLSSFTQTFSSWQKEGRHISQPKIRRMVYFKNRSNSDEKNQCDNAMGHVMTFINRGREKVVNGDYPRNPQDRADDLARTKVPDVNSLRESMSNSFVLNSENNDLRLHRRKKRADDSNQNVFSSKTTTGQPFQYSSANTEVLLKELGNDETNNSSVQSSSTEVWANRAKLKFITVRPWNQFCLTCDNRNNLNDDRCVKAYHSGHTKRKKTNTPCYRHMNSISTTALYQPWLFFAGSVKTRVPAGECSSSAIVSENRQLSPNLNLERNNHTGHFLIFRPRNKKRNNVLQRALKRKKKGTDKNNFISYIFPLTTYKSMCGGINTSGKKKLCPPGKNIFHNNLLSRINTFKKRSLELIENEKNSDLVGFILLGRRHHKLNKGIPSCQKSSYYNLSNLVNAKTVKPNDYLKDKPVLRLSCEDCVSVSDPSTKQVLQTSGTNNVSISDMSFTDDSTIVSDDLQSGTTESNPDLNNSTNSSTTSNMTTVSAPGTTPTVVQMFKQLRTLSNNETITAKPKDKFNLQVSLKNKDDLIIEKPESKIESIPKILYYLISSKNNDTFEDNPSIINMIKAGSLKKIQPWDKFCPCSGGKLSTLSGGGPGLNRQPWASACSVCISTKGENNINEDDADKIDVDSESISTVKSHVSVVQIISKPLEEEDNPEDLKSNHSRSNRKSLLLIRVPIAGPVEHDRNGSLNSNLPSNSTTNTKHVMPRSILDIFMPSLLRRTTIRPIMHVVKPWEEPWKFRQEKFSLFTTSEYATYVSGRNTNNPSTTTNEPPPVSKSLLEYIAETCPSCSKLRKASLSTTDKQSDGIETEEECSYEEVCIDNPTSNELSNEKFDLQYTSDLLTLPEVHLIGDNHPPLQKVKSLKGLTIFKSQDSPPKYYIEVPQPWSRLRNIAVGARTTALPLVTQPISRPENMNDTVRKKLVILYLQPFDINGNSVYLPMSDIDVPVVEEVSTVGYDREEQTLNLSNKIIGNGILHKNDSGLPFVLVPAYLAMHPHSTTPQFLQDTDYLTSANVDINSMLYSGSRDSNTKSKDIEVEHFSHISTENKHTLLTKQLRYTLPITVASRINVTRKSHRKHLFGKSSVVSSRPTYIILMNGMADSHNVDGAEFPLNKGDFSFMNQKGAVTIEPIEDYLLI